MDRAWSAKLKLAAALLLLLASYSHATLQKPEVLFVDSQVVYIQERPLAVYLLNSRDSIKVTHASTSLRRGYVGIWRISESKLFLTDLKSGWSRDSLSICRIFKKCDGEPIPADWYTGVLTIRNPGDYYNLGGEFFKPPIKLFVENGSITNFEEIGGKTVLGALKARRIKRYLMFFAPAAIMAALYVAKPLY